jgi:hypothetical protein
MTSSMFPHIDPQLIDKVNYRIDHPTAGDKMMGRAKKTIWGNSAGFAPGLFRGGHRQYNHDIMTMIQAAYEAGGLKGVQVGMAHIAQDMLSDYLTKTLGPDAANLFEAAWLMSQAPPRKRRRR